MSNKNPIQFIKDLIFAAGGEIQGSIKLQKIVYLLEKNKMGNGYRFYYWKFGPYSDELHKDVKIAWAFDDIVIEEKNTSWGGQVDAYKNKAEYNSTEKLETFIKFVTYCNKINSTELELIATAIYLFDNGYSDPWRELEKRKKVKAEKYMGKARKSYSDLAIYFPSLSIENSHD